MVLLDALYIRHVIIRLNLLRRIMPLGHTVCPHRELGELLFSLRKLACHLSPFKGFKVLGLLSITAILCESQKQKKNSPNRLTKTTPTSSVNGEILLASGYM